jgi:hypothetical protein
MLALILALAAIAQVGCSRSPALDRWPIAHATSHRGEQFVAYATPPRGFGISLTTHVIQVRDHVTAICPVPERGMMVFTPTGGFDIESGRDVWCEQPKVREAVWLGDDRMALLVRGRTTARRPARPAEPRPWLTGAEVRPAWIAGDRLAVGEAGLPSGVNPWALRAGRFAGEDDNLLVFVYTEAPFDAVIRRRPWIFRVVEGDDALPHLEPRWRGTSFSRPFRDATFGDFTGTGEGEVAALEVTRDEGRVLTAYRFRGFGLEGLAPSAELPPVEDRLETVHRGGSAADALVVRATDGRFLFLELDPDAAALRETMVIEGPPAVLGWTIAGTFDDRPGSLTCVLPDGRVWESGSADRAEAAGAG